MSVSFLISQAKSVQKVIDENSAEIEVLDQKIGDGDHIFNIQRGLKLVVELEDSIKDLPLAKALANGKSLIESSSSTTNFKPL